MDGHHAPQLCPPFFFGKGGGIKIICIVEYITKSGVMTILCGSLIVLHISQGPVSDMETPEPETIKFKSFL